MLQVLSFKATKSLNMKNKSLLLFLILSSFSIELISQRGIFLDSIIHYNNQGNISIKEIVIEKDHAGRILEIESSGRSVNTAIKYEYFNSGGRKSLNQFYWFPDHDTTLVLSERTFTETGFNQTWHSFSRQVSALPDTLIHKVLSESWDTTFFDQNDFPTSAKNYLSRDSGSKFLDKERQYFFSNQLKDSVLTYRVFDNQTVLLNKEFFVYDNFGNLIKNTVFDHRGFPLDERTFEYDTNNRQILRTGKDFNSNNTFQIITEYSQDGTNSIETFNYFDASGIEISGNRVDTFYLNNGAIDSISIQSRNAADNPWEVIESAKYHYSNVTSVSNSKTNQLNIDIYPNPANEKIHFRGQRDITNCNVKITDIYGKTIIFLPLDNHSFDVSSLKQGIYFAFIENDYVGKFVKN